jgi:hypothetical protein
MFFLFSSCDTPISKYETKNEDEKEVIDLLTRYTEAINKGDAEQIIPLFHENGVYVTGRTKDSLSREKMAEWNSENWLMDGQRKLYNPEITINGNEAKVIAKVMYGNTSYTQVYTLVKENNEWLIMKRE